jgi:hypothetical protein
MGKGLQIARNLHHLVSDSLHRGLDLRGIISQLFEIDCHDRKSLVDVVVKLPGNPGALSLLCLYQAAAQLGEPFTDNLAILYESSKASKGVAATMRNSCNENMAAAVPAALNGPCP